MNQLEKLNQKITNCKKCSLWKTAQNAVPGEGPANAKIMFIGEAPGQKEDLIGKPFVGRAGKLLTQLLEKNRLERKKFFITSVLKHRPPKNRQPKKSELKSCKDWWQKQITIIKPRLIVLLGKVAFDTVIGEGQFSDSRGKLLTKNGKLYFPVYHPAAGLRFPKIRKVLENDFQKLK